MDSPALQGNSLHKMRNSPPINARSLASSVNPEGQSVNRPQWVRGAVLLAVLAALWLADQSVFHLGDQVRAWSEGLQPAAGLWALSGGMLIYAVLLSFPFVPGIELGLALMLVFGLPGIAMAYGGTILGLCIAFTCGRWIRTVPGGFGVDWRAAFQVHLYAVLPRAKQTSGILRRVAGSILRHPVLLLAALLNMPGNTVLGGGGGIAMLFGATHALRWPAFFLTIAIATAPGPLLFLMRWMMT